MTAECCYCEKALEAGMKVVALEDGRLAHIACAKKHGATVILTGGLNRR